MTATPLTTTSCAACARPLRGERHFEPIGPGDSLVALCGPCALEDVVPKENITPHSLLASHAMTPVERRARVKKFKDALAARGICVNGKKHGPAVRGKLCERCAEVCAAGMRRRRGEAKAQASAAPERAS